MLQLNQKRHRSTAPPTRGSYAIVWNFNEIVTYKIKLNDTTGVECWTWWFYMPSANFFSVISRLEPVNVWSLPFTIVMTWCDASQCRRRVLETKQPTRSHLAPFLKIIMWKSSCFSDSHDSVATCQSVVKSTRSRPRWTAGDNVNEFPA